MRRSIIISVFIVTTLFCKHTYGIEWLTLVEKPCKEQQESTPLAIIYTGDGGWRPYDEILSDSLNAMHIPVLGINSLHYFRKRRTPEEAATEIVPVIKKYLGKWNKKTIVLVGYSFGAEVVPFIYNQLPTEIKTKVKVLTLLTPSNNSDFKTHLADRLGFSLNVWKYNVKKEIAAIKTIPIIAFWGVEEKPVFTLADHQNNLQIFYLAGGHNFKDATTVANQIYKQL